MAARIVYHSLVWLGRLLFHGSNISPAPGMECPYWPEDWVETAFEPTIIRICIMRALHEINPSLRHWQISLSWLLNLPGSFRNGLRLPARSWLRGSAEASDLKARFALIACNPVPEETHIAKSVCLHTRQPTTNKLHAARKTSVILRRTSIKSSGEELTG